MLKRVIAKEPENEACVKISQADFPSPFRCGLEFNPPARGPWNIVHTGMLIPESHQIYVCAQGCLRGVILTAAEMNAMDRMSWVSLQETDMFDGSIDENIVQGTADILHKMELKRKLPRAVLVFISCMHLFAGCDFSGALSELRQMFPTIDFIDCYMHPTMRKNGLTPDQMMRRQLYAPLQNKIGARDKSVNIIGNDRPTQDTSELLHLIYSAGYEVRDITSCKTYEEYLKMGESQMNITYLPSAVVSGDRLSQRLGQEHLYLPLSYSYDEIEAGYRQLATKLGIKVPDYKEERSRADRALRDALEQIGYMPIELDYTATSRPLGLARLLIEHGFRVQTIYVDAMNAEEREDFEWLRKHIPELLISATVEVRMRYVNHRPHDTEILAIGQKAAYFSGTRHFVNMVAGNGLYGFDGIIKLTELMKDAYLHEKDTQTVIQYKGLGCESCL